MSSHVLDLVRIWHEGQSGDASNLGVPNLGKQSLIVILNGSHVGSPSLSGPCVSWFDQGMQLSLATFHLWTLFSVNFNTQTSRNLDNCERAVAELHDGNPTG